MRETYRSELRAVLVTAILAAVLVILFVPRAEATGRRAPITRCAPGVWTCITDPTPTTKPTPRRPAPCPSGVWTCITDPKPTTSPTVRPKVTR